MAKGIIDVIKYEGDNKTFIYKYPAEDFNFGTQLIVHQSQEAVLFQDGKALQSFQAGAYTLDTKNYPILRNALSVLAGGKDIFHSEVYFINLTTQLGIKWGTDSKVRLFDPLSGLHLELGASGTFNLKVNDGRKLLIKVVGTSGGFRQEEIFGSVGYPLDSSLSAFRGMIVSKVKSALARTIREEKINILEVDEHLNELSEKLRLEINPVLEEYGMYVPEFFISTIQTPDDDRNFMRMKEQYAARYLKVEEQRILKAEAEAAREVVIVEAETAAQKKMIEAQAQAAAEAVIGRGHGEALRAQGATYGMESARMIGVKAAENESGNGALVSDLVQAGIGLGVGAQVARQVVGTMNGGIEASEPHASPAGGVEGWECPSCHYMRNKGNFCEECGTKRPSENSAWTCSQCGMSGLSGKFCPNCGAKRGE